MKRQPFRVALVLSGGGSRGAYAAGVLLYLREHLQARLGLDVHLDIVTGTSVGAINAAYIAATIDDPAHQAQRLCDLWRSLEMDHVIALRVRDVMRQVRLLLGGDPAPPAPGSYHYGGLLDTAGLERTVVKSIPWRGIRRNLRRGDLQALAVSATHVGSGHTRVFVDRRSDDPLVWSRDPHMEHHTARIGPRHVLASAAIPMLFPSVKIGDAFFTDGGLRQNTPMLPAICLGADRLLVVSLRHVGTKADDDKNTPERELAFPKPLYLAGKALNALLLDHADYDLARLERLNQLIEAGSRVFGADFEARINAELATVNGTPVRRLQAVRIRPSVDIGTIAARHVASGKVKLMGRVARRLLRRLGRGESSGENDLLSYLLFDGRYAAELIELGYRDAQQKQDELVSLFSPGAAL